MSFKLIREAQTVSRLGTSADLAKTVQAILGKGSITNVAGLFEAFDSSAFQISPEDYNVWMQTLQAEAAERGANLSKKTDFEDLAHYMFENDPRIDELGLDDKTVQQIVTTMWASYKASKAHAGVQRGVEGAIGRAREEEEAAAKESGFGQAFKQAQGAEDEEKEIKATKVQGSGSWAPRNIPKKFKKPSFGQEGEEKSVSRWERAAISAHPGGKRNPYAPGSLRHSLWNDVHGAEENEEDVDVGERPSLDFDDLASTERTSIPGEEGVPGDSDVESRIDDLESRVADIEAGEADEPWHDDDDQVDIDLDTDFSGKGEQQPARVTVEDEEQVKKNMFRQAITAPRTELSQALKDVEGEGQKAWKELQLAKNPHPPKSQAHNAWQKGFRNSAKEHLGIVDKPATPAKKPAKRR